MPYMSYTLVSGALVVVGAVVGVVFHLVGHRGGRIPAWCFVARTRTRELFLYCAIVGGTTVVGTWADGRSSSALEDAPAVLFLIAGLLAVWALVRLGVGGWHVVRGDLHETHGRWTAVGSERGDDGSILWEEYLEVAGHHARIDTPSSRRPPEIRAPADERATEGRVWVHGIVREGAPISVWIGSRLVHTKEAEVGGLSVVAAREAENLRD